MLIDAHGRAIRDLRISLTDRCNFRCFYCLPNGEPPLARRETILTFEEIERAAHIFVSLGIEKIRLTGGEPMLRRGIVDLISRLSKLKPRLKDLALTTNGHAIPRLANELKTAGLDRITLSLDSLDRQRFRDITGVDGIRQVFDSIAAARSAGFQNIKVNAVIVRGRNDDELVAMAEFARDNSVSMRFIEFMPLDSGHGWDRDKVVSGRDIFTAVNDAFPLTLKDTSRGSGTAWNYVFADGSPGEIGIIAPVTESFCGQCSRIRLTADGQIRTCLFSLTEYDLRSVLRAEDDDLVAKFIRGTALKKESGHQISSASFQQPARTMSFIGG